jgi:hypothetical protein
MAEEQERKSWADIIDKVRTILALSALAVLAAGAGLTAVIWNNREWGFLIFVLMISFLLVLVVANMIYSYRLQHETNVLQQELILGIHVARKDRGVERPVEGAEVILYRNGTLVKKASTNDMGYLALPVTLDRKDELYVVVMDNVTGKRSNKAALYSAGQFQVVKKIVF